MASTTPQTVSVPHIPMTAPLTDSGGYLAPSWALWFQQVFSRIGGNQAYSNTTLATLAQTSLVPIQTQVTALQTSVTALQAQVNALTLPELGLGVGPDL